RRAGADAPVSCAFYRDGCVHVDAPAALRQHSSGPGALPGKDGRAMRGMRRTTWASMLAAMLLLCAGLAHAQRTEGDRASASGPYEAEVAVRNQADGERNAAFGRALAAV